MTGDRSDPGVDQMMMVRERDGQAYAIPARVLGDLTGPPTRLRLPHVKGMTPEAGESEVS